MQKRTWKSSQQRERRPRGWSRALFPGIQPLGDPSFRILLRLILAYPRDDFSGFAGSHRRQYQNVYEREILRVMKPPRPAR